ncbi:MAG: Lon protease family protein [Desulfovibrio sp.]
MTIKKNRLDIDKLRWRMDPATLHFESTNDLEPHYGIIGQKRGVDAFGFGMDMDVKGYNIFVTGPTGIGKLSTVKKLFDELSDESTPPDDLLYVNNFKEPERPSLIRMRAGEGQVFKKDITEFLEDIKRAVPQMFESQEYVRSKELIIEQHDKQVRDFVRQLENKVKESGFVLVNMQMGQVQRPDIFPLIDDEPVHLMQLEEKVEKGTFPAEEFEKLSQGYKKLKAEVDHIFLEIRQLQKDVQKKSENIDKLMFTNTAKDLIHPLMDRFTDKKVHQFFSDMIEDMADNLDSLRAMGAPAKPEGPMGMGFMAPPPEVVLAPYNVNLLVDNSEQKGKPVIIETYPTYRNLFGSIERVMDRNGMWRTDFTKIKAGSFVKANGGYLVINLMDAMQEPGVWKTLKRALMTSTIEIETFDPYYVFVAATIKPESIDMEVKVVVLAEPNLYAMLKHYDPEVSKIFKVRADFDPIMCRDDEAVQKVSTFIRSACDEHGLMPFDRTGVAQVLEHAVRMAGRQEKLTTAFPMLEDLLVESAHYAKKDNVEFVTSEYVRKAIDGRIQRANLPEERLQEMIDRGSVFIDVDGEKVGQVNGLAVYSMGDIMFGKPSRITATVSMGKEGIINIERESDLSGAIHNKGMLILSGFLRDRFAQNKPLSLAASIAFEQSYGGIDGDSASSTELYALLSALSGKPINQGIAVTGSVNQRGEVQPIGGVNQKIEGFFKTCRNKGLTGKQGVMIPVPNVKDLMLREEVLEAVRDNQFHVWSVSTIEEGIEILTGHDAGTVNEEGEYPEDTIFGLADARLTDLAHGLRDFGKGPDDEESAKDDCKDAKSDDMK